MIRSTAIGPAGRQEAQSSGTMAEPAPKKQNTASRQLRELQRLMAWSWDSR